MIDFLLLKEIKLRGCFIRKFQTKSLTWLEFQYFVIRQTFEKESTVLKLSRKLILQNNNVESLLKNWQKKCSKYLEIFSFYIKNEFVDFLQFIQLFLKNFLTIGIFKI